MFPAEHKLLIHKTDKDSPTVAAVDLSRALEGICVIQFHQPEAAMSVEHVHHKFPFTHANTYFGYGNKNYHWKAHSALVEDDTRICLAVHHRTNLGGHLHKLGSIVLTHEGMKLKDMVLVTGLTEQARSDEAKLEVRIPNKLIILISTRSLKRNTSTTVDYCSLTL